MQSLGSNLTLKDKIVRVDLEKPLHFIELVINKDATIAARLEPEDKLGNTIQLEALWAKNPSMLRD